jgi:uncharacterized protein YjiS (DUF1127 family)
LRRHFQTEVKMSRTELASPVAVEPDRPALRTLPDRLRRAWLEARSRWAARRDRRHLMELPDEMLRDIGLGRSEIDSAVRSGRRS